MLILWSKNTNNVDYYVDIFIINIARNIGFNTLTCNFHLVICKIYIIIIIVCLAYEYIFW